MPLTHICWASLTSLCSANVVLWVNVVITLSTVKVKCQIQAQLEIQCMQLFLQEYIQWNIQYKLDSVDSIYGIKFITTTKNDNLSFVLLS